MIRTTGKKGNCGQNPDKVFSSSQADLENLNRGQSSVCVSGNKVYGSEGLNCVQTDVLPSTPHHLRQFELSFFCSGSPAGSRQHGEMIFSSQQVMFSLTEWKLRGEVRVEGWEFKVK